MKRYAQTLTELAMILERGTHTLHRWSLMGAPTKKKHKTAKGYDTAAVKRWAVEAGLWGSEGRPGAGVKVDPDGPTKTTRALREHQATERQYKARIAELTARKLEGDLVSIADVASHDRKRHEYMIGTLESWARSLGPLLAGKTAMEINRIMLRKIDELMSEFSGRKNGR